MARVIITEKKCPACLQVKPRSAYYQDARGQLVAYCIVCSLLKQKARLAAKQKPIQNLPNEQWRDVEDYVGLYQISDFGRVQRLEGPRCTIPRIIKPQLVKGYPCVSLCVGRTRRVRSVHSMVAIAFIGPYPVGQEVNHLDHDRANPRLDNLEYRTHKGNMEYASEHKRFHVKPRGKLHAIDIPKIRQMFHDGLNAPVVARQFNVSVGAVQSVKWGKNWKHI